MVKVRKDCIFCLSSFLADKTTILNGQLKLNEFYSDVIQRNKNGGGGGGNGDDELSLGNNYSLCLNCLPMVTTSLDKRRQGISVEMEVIRLQNEVLKELRKMEGFITQFYEEMRSIQDVITAATSNITQDNGTNEDEFRSRILMRVNDLALFRQSLHSKTTACQEDPDPDPNPAPGNNNDDEEYAAVKSEPLDELNHCTIDSDEDLDQDNLSGDHFKGMTPFRRQVVSRVLRRRNKVLGRRRSRLQLSMDPNPGVVQNWRYFYDLYLIDYQSDKGILIIEDLEIEIHDEEDNHNQNYLLCKTCSFKVHDNPENKSLSTVEHQMYEHILGYHLKAYRCTGGGDKCNAVFSNQTYLQKHLKIHSEAYQLDKKLRKATLNCPYLGCEKVFKLKKSLEDHIDKHKDPNGGLTVCVDCGKRMVKPSLYTHQRYYCEGARGGGDGGRVQCPKCPPGVTLKNEKVLYFHLKRQHDEKEDDKMVSFLCDKCPKRFKRRGPLNLHRKRHEEEGEGVRSWICGRGCGWKFKEERNLRRHEKLCEGMGTRHRPVGGKKFKQSLNLK